MKKLHIDFNEPDRIRFRINEDEIRFFNIELGEIIKFYTENFEVKAIVEFDVEENRWFGKHIEEIRYIPTEIEEAREDGFINGHYFGVWTTKNNVVRKMHELNLSEDLIHEITGLNLDRIRLLR